MILISRSNPTVIINNNIKINPPKNIRNITSIASHTGGLLTNQEYKTPVTAQNGSQNENDILFSYNIGLLCDNE